MKYKLMPENSEKNNIRSVKKLLYPLGKNSSATIKAIAKPDIAASGNEYGICFLLMSTPSLFANVSFLMKRVFEKCLTIIGTKIIVDHINIVPRLYLACCSFETLIVTAIPKLIPNQNTKFHSLSLFSHLGCFVFKLHFVL